MTDLDAPDPTAERIRALMARKGWSNKEAARMLGIPVTTLINWVQGDKKPSAIVKTFIDVLQKVELFAPHVYDNLFPKGE